MIAKNNTNRKKLQSGLIMNDCAHNPQSRFTLGKHRPQIAACEQEITFGTK